MERDHRTNMAVTATSTQISGSSSGLRSRRFLRKKRKKTDVKSLASSLYEYCFKAELHTHHHQVAVLCPVDHGLLATLEVHKALSARLDVKSHTAMTVSILFFFYPLDFQHPYFYMNSRFCTCPGPR